MKIQILKHGPFFSVESNVEGSLVRRNGICRWSSHLMGMSGQIAAFNTVEDAIAAAKEANEYGKVVKEVEI